ncbi:GNAT family N-acetyltransferase [Pseudoalteromonas pernae]|uniref:GNAT family N-acetyltransferase n=1 Tax=Pseudoalteromonas pernae TaxID=3118054 RepID=UPI0032425B86
MAINIEFVVDDTFSSIYFYLESAKLNFMPSLDAQVDIKSYSQKLSDNAHNVFSVDPLTNERVGYCAYYINEFQSLIYISSISVISSVQGKGFGRALFQYVIDQAELHKLEEIQLEVHSSNLQARNFYKKLGFAVKKENKNTLILSLTLVR